MEGRNKLYGSIFGHKESRVNKNRFFEKVKSTLVTKI